MLKLLKRLIIFGVLLSLIGGGLLAWLLTSPVAMKSERVEFHIAPGSSLRSAAGEIVNAGVRFEPRLLSCSARRCVLKRQSRPEAMKSAREST